MTDPGRTPRDWLLARHARADPSLDAIRQRVVAANQLTPARAGGVEVHSTADLLAAVFSPYRRAWAALGIIWLFLAVLHLTIARPAAITLQAAPPKADALAFRLAHLDPHDALAHLGRMD